MELWIRSQDKRTLVKANRIYMTSDLNTTDGDFDYNIWMDEDNVGTYKTKERALEVLDEIQSLLKSKVLLNSGKILESFEDTIYREPDKVEIQELNTIVYEMPKE